MQVFKFIDLVSPPLVFGHMTLFLIFIRLFLHWVQLFDGETTFFPLNKLELL